MRQTNFLLPMSFKHTIATFTRYRIAFRGGAKKQLYPIRNVRFSQA